MGFAHSYLNKNSFSILEIPRAPMGLLRYIIVIPAFNEPDIILTLQSILTCKRPIYFTEVFVLFNCSSTASTKVKDENRVVFEQVKNWCAKQQIEHLDFFVFNIDNLPEKHAGVGLARKILMDSAVYRFEETNNENGLIISLDADTLVPENYLVKIESEYSQTNCNCLIMNFAHQLNGENLSPEIYLAIAKYEIYLRYYKNMLAFSGFPYSYYTIGSCFAIQAEAYIKAGGMNRRQAGEDFYFLHKIFPNNKVKFIPDVIVEPSPRISDRVPFGTGPTIKKILENNDLSYFTYTIVSFLDLKELFRSIITLYKINKSDIEAYITRLPKSMKNFLPECNFIEKIIEINNNCASSESFQKRFFAWFNGFLVVKFLNYARDNYYPATEITNASKLFLEMAGIKCTTTDYFEILEKLRKLDMD